jgi:alpha-tubulin suppressor-like RCC1 family protein
VSSGPKHTLAWSSAFSQIWAFGDNSDGSLGLGDQDLHCGIARLESFSDAAEYGIAVSSVAVGEGHSLVLAHNKEESGRQYVFGWGENSFNQLGEDGCAPQDQDEVLVLVPHQVLSEFSQEIASLHCFSNYSAVTTCDGKVDQCERGIYLGQRRLRPIRVPASAEAAAGSSASRPESQSGESGSRQLSCSGVDTFRPSL